jgi:hypothetical protein
MKIGSVVQVIKIRAEGSNMTLVERHFRTSFIKRRQDDATKLHASCIYLDQNEGQVTNRFGHFYKTN